MVRGFGTCGSFKDCVGYNYGVFFRGVIVGGGVVKVFGRGRGFIVVVLTPRVASWTLGVIGG